MSSLKMTFSLTSLILIIALGLVFAPTAVLAHVDGKHQHPVLTAIADEDPDTDGAQAVDPHTGHPMVTSIVLKEGANVRGTTAAVAADDGDDATTESQTFTLVITFDQAVTAAATDLTVSATAPTLTTTATQLFADKLTADTGTAPTIAAPTRVSGDTTNTKFEAEVTIGSFPTGAATGNDREMYLRVSVNAGGAFSLAQRPGHNVVSGGASLASDSDMTTPGQQPHEFMLVKVLPAAPDTMAPTLTITAPDMPNTDGNLEFTFDFNEALATTGDHAFTLGDIDVEGGEKDDLTAPDADHDYTLVVIPDSATATVTVSIKSGAVIGDGTNAVDISAVMPVTYDKTKPTVTITAPTAPLTAPAADVGKLVFTFVFSEPIKSSTFTATDIIGEDYVVTDAPMMDATDTTMKTYTAKVKPTSDEGDDVTVVLNAEAVEDLAGNTLAAGVFARYTPATAESTVPTVTIAAVGYMVGGNVVGINCEMGNVLTFTATDNQAIATGSKVDMSEVSASTGWKIAAGSTAGSIMVVPKGDGTEIGVTSVTVTVAANAVMDTAGNGNAETMMTFTVGPVLTIPGGGYIVVIRPEHRTVTHLGDPLYIGHTGVRAPRIIPQHWECMPDLTVFFGRAAPAIGGGALVVKKSPEHGTGAIGTGTVGITEIMWASDEGIAHGGTPLVGRSNIDQTREQWVELHNRNTTAVTVTLVARPTNAALVTEADEIDRVSNYNIDNVWEVKGQSGNSARGIDFVSMKRAQAGDKNYNHGDVSGTNKDKWTASTLSYNQRQATLATTGVLASENLTYDFRGTPGRSNSPGITSPTTRKNVPKDSIVFNEIANRRDQTLEWIELKNVSSGEVNLKKYQISLATAKDNDVAFYTFPDNDNIKLAAGEVLLLLDTSPRDNDAHPIAVGQDRDTGNDQALGLGQNQDPKAHLVKYKVANFREGGLPDDGNFVLYLRNRNDRLKSHEGVIDVVGWSNNLEDAGLHTKFWPLAVFDGRRWEKGGPDERNKIAVETVHYRQHRIDPDANTHKDDKDEHQALRDAGYTGIGYKRHAQRIAAHGGTPGYEEIRKNENPQLANGNLTISEIMYDQGDGQFPQWIEIYNSSETEAVNLHAGDHGWRLLIENFDDGEIPVKRLSGTLNFRSSEVQTILPQQTVIVASTRARNSGSAFFDTRVVFPATRVFSAWDDARGEFDMKRSTDPILSEEGFYIELIDGKNNFVDGVGNLVKSPNRRVAATIEWPLSEITGEMMDDDGRSSILRRYREYRDGRLVGTYTDTEIEDMGVEAAGWIAAHKTDFLDVRQTWFGHPTDKGSPGITGGRVLPVQLSKFRPERLESGEIVIRWITESELNNAGFNILRSDTRDGEYKQINTQLILGKGTTSERNTYEWKDTSAKPNVVYYYQIQDVSLDGKVQTLRMSRLRGHISAAGKLTTTWGELKALQ